MNALAIVAPGLPPASAPLAEALATAARNASYDGPAMDLVVPDAVRGEAARRADILEAGLAPAGAETAKRWLLHLALLTANPPRELEAAASLMAQYLGTLPAKVFTPRTLESMAEASKFWPTYQDAKTHLLAILSPVQAEIAMLRRVSATQAPTPAQEARPDPAALRAQVEALKRDMAAAQPPRPVAACKARPLTPDQLIATYRQQIERGGPMVGAARVRLAALEARA